VLAVARSPDGAPLHAELGRAATEPPDGVHDFQFEPMGLVGLADPLRAEVPAAIARARSAGVRVLMITGDGPVTARSIADQAGLPDGPVLTGAELESFSEAELAARLEGASVFARVRPEQKLRLVRALQRAGEVVAMGGDGVNDAPALRAADIGVAMGRRGTAVARESADLVLLQDSFAGLVEALALGRRIEANLQRALGYTLAIHLPIVALSLVPLLSPHQGLILLPAHIALLHLVIDPACTVVFEALPGPPGLMERPPRSPRAPLLNPATWHRALGQGAVLSLAALALALWPGLALEVRRSLAFALLLLAGGALVALNGDRRSGLSRWSLALSVGLWLVLMGIQPLRELLRLAPLSLPRLHPVSGTPR
jgi:Ca2+-transporting ATPase